MGEALCGCHCMERSRHAEGRDPRQLRRGHVASRRLCKGGQLMPGMWIGVQGLLIISPHRIIIKRGVERQPLIITLAVCEGAGAGAGAGGHTLGLWVLRFRGSVHPLDCAGMCQLCPGTALYSEPWGPQCWYSFLQKVPAEPGPVRLGVGVGAPALPPVPQEGQEAVPRGGSSAQPS